MCHRSFIDVRGFGPVAVTAAALALLSIVPGISYADDGEDSSDEEDEGVTVHTVDRVDLQRDDPRFASALTTRISTDDLSLRGRDLGDALSQVTGVYVRRDSSRGQPAHPTIRGGNSRQMVVELDGLRLSSPVGPGFNAGTMISEGVESVDVHRGTTAVTHGGGAVTGAVQLNPAVAAGDQLEWTGRARTGSFGNFAAEASTGIADDHAGLRVHGGYEQSRGDFPFITDQGEHHRRVNNDHRRVDLGATGHINHGDHRLRMTGMFQSGDAGSPGPSQFQNSFDSARSSDRSGLVAARWDRRALIDEPGLIVDARATAGAHQRDHHYRNDDSRLTGVAFDSRSTTRNAGGSTSLAAYIGDNHMARVNLEGRSESHVGVVDSGTSLSHIKARRHTGAITVSDHWLIADETISLLGAVRTEYALGEKTTNVEPFLPAVGAIIRPHRRVQLRANASRTFRLPHFDELYLETEHVRGNPDLEPERAWTADAAIELGAGDDPVALQAAYFHHAIDSTILFLPATARLFEAQSLRGAISNGVELAGRAEVADRFQIRAGYTHTRARLADSDRPEPVQLPGRPRHRVGVESTIDLTGLAIWSELNELRILPSVHYRSPLNFDHFGHLRGTPSLRVDLGATVGFNDHVRAAVQLHNLLDDRHSRDRLYRPLPGRTLFTSIEITGGR